MSVGLNKVMLIGRLGKDPEVKATPSGTPVARFSIATDESYKDKGGKKVEKTEWHNVVAWGKLAEVVEQYVGKGQLVYIEGSLKTDSWEDQSTGQKRYRTEINARELKMLEWKKDDREGGGRDDYRGGSKSSKYTEPEDDDVPF